MGADGVVGVLPGKERGAQVGQRRLGVGHLVELLGVGAVGAVDAAVLASGSGAAG